MPQPTFTAYLSGARPYTSVSVRLASNPLDPVAKWPELSDIINPGIEGYAPLTFATFADLFPTMQNMGQGVTRMVSRYLRWENTGTTGGEVRHLLIVVAEPSGPSQVLLCVTCTKTWAPKEKIGGRLYLSKNWVTT